MVAVQTLPLDTFNQMVLQHQEEAFTLAYHLVGSDQQAERIVEKAVVQAYREFQGRTNEFRCRLLQLVIQAGQKLGTARPYPGLPETYARRMVRLPERQRCTLILVDVLGMDYNDAAGIMQTSPRQVGQWLAAARLAVSHVQP